jgi:hypothetical protein
VSVQTTPSPAADLLREVLLGAGHDLADFGIPTDGPLDWTPRSPTEGDPLGRVEVVRDRVLARHRVTDLYRRGRELRAISGYWRERR